MGILNENLKRFTPNKRKFLTEKHAKLANLDKYIELTSPDYTGNDFDTVDEIEKEAEENGQLEDLQSAAMKTHYGRHRSGWGTLRMDMLEYRNRWIKSTKNRITKGGKLNKNSASWLKNIIKRARK